VLTVGRSVAALLLVFMAGSARADAPLTAADVSRFLKAGISEQTILLELQNRGFAEPLDATREATLREAGASETLMVAIRRVAPAPSPVAKPKSVPRPSVYAPGVLVTPLDGQEPTFAVATRTVRVPVSVLDAKGRPVLGLRDADFRISEDGKRQGVTLFSGERRPLRLAIALDISRSMDNKVRQVEEALRHFIELLEPADEILVMTFNDRLHIVQDFTSDRQLLARVLDNLEPVGGTALYDAAFESIRRVAAGPAESKAVVLVTDGVDTASAVAFQDLREFAKRKEVPVFSIGLDSGRDLSDVFRPPTHSGGGGGGHGGWPGGMPGGGGRGGWPGGGGRGGGPGGGGGGHYGSGMSRKGFDERPLMELADDTGGRAEIVKGPQHYTPDDGGSLENDRLKQAVESIAMTLRHRYLLGYEPPEGKRGWHDIRVEVDKPDATPHARKGYYAGG
jgi:VWFA-related protein